MMPLLIIRKSVCLNKQFELFNTEIYQPLFLNLKKKLALKSLISSQLRRTWGGGVMGAKSQARMAKIEKARARELQTKMA